MSDSLPETVVVSADGSEEAARAFATRELERIAVELEQEEAEPEPVRDVFTVYLFPFDGDRQPGHGTDDLIPVNFPWSDSVLLARRMRREVDHVYATQGANKTWELWKAIKEVRGIG